MLLILLMLRDSFCIYVDRLVNMLCLNMYICVFVYSYIYIYLDIYMHYFSVSILCVCVDSYATR